MDFLLALTDQFTLNGGFAFSDSETNQGDPLPFAPDTKISLAAAYEIPLASGASLRNECQLHLHGRKAVWKPRPNG